MVQYGDIFTFRLNQTKQLKTLEKPFNIGFFGFFDYVLSITISLEGGKRFDYNFLIIFHHLKRYWFVYRKKFINDFYKTFR